MDDKPSTSRVADKRDKLDGRWLLKEEEEENEINRWAASDAMEKFTIEKVRD
ncbi:MAG: hypothetical protein Q9197_002555 [Variospora fuerteventurae]